MTQIPQNAVTMEDLTAWNDLQEQLRKIKASEMILRQKIWAGLFVAPVEGTNTVALGNDGWELKGVRSIDRKIQLEVLQAMAVENGPLHQAGIRAADLVEWKPELKIKEYRTLTAEQKLVFDQCLTIKDGSPQLKIVLPAKATKAAS